MSVKMFMVTSVAGGLLAFLFLFGAVVATGQTFGQRCTSVGFIGEEHSECVSRLAAGGVE